MKYQTLLSCLAASVLLVLNHSAHATSPAPQLTAKRQTQPTLTGEANSAVVVRNAAKPEASYIVGTAALGGLEVYDLAGKRLGKTAAGEVASVDVAYDIALGKTKATVLAAVDTTDNRLRLFTMQGPALTEVGARAMPLGFAAEGVCLFQNPLDGSLNAFIVGDGGEVDQQILFPTAQGKLDARQVRRISLPSPLKQCVADSKGHVYASEEGVGIWRFNADPEADTGATVVLGRGSEDELVARSERFLRTVSQVTGRFQRDLEYADLRHADGYAVRLRGITTTLVPANAAVKKSR